jgi:uncharacterized protein
MDFGVMGLVLRLGIGLAIGFCIGMTAVGNVLVIPSVTLILGLSPSTAVGTTCLYALLTKVFASYRHSRLGNVDFRTSVLLLATAVPTNVLVSLLINQRTASVAGCPQASQAFQAGLQLFIGAVILLSVVLLIVNLVGKARSSDHQGRIARWVTARPGARRSITAGVGILIGALVGSTSVGGAVVMMPLLIILVGIPAARAVGTSIFIGVILPFVTVLIYGRGGEIDIATAITMWLGSTLGVYWGSKLSAKLPERKLQAAVIVVILAAGILMMAN